MSFFSDFQYVFRSSQSTTNLTVVSDRTARAFNTFGPTRAAALNIFGALDRVWHAGLLHKLKSYRISGQIFDLISSFLSNRWLLVVLDGKSSQEYLVKLESLKGPFLVLQFSYHILMTFMIILSTILLSILIIYSLIQVLRSIWSLEKLELAFELLNPIYETVDWGRKWLDDFNTKKTQLVLFD